MSDYRQEGKVLEFSNGTGSDIAAGDVVVMGDTVGIALADIADGESGSVLVEGVVANQPKTTGTAWSQGAVLDWDASAGEFTDGATPATGDVIGCGIAAADAASGDATGSVKLTPGTGAVQ